MDTAEFDKRFAVFLDTVDAAQEAMGVPGMVIYGFSYGGENGQPAETTGGESLFIPGKMTDGGVEASFEDMVTLLGFIGGRVEILKQEASAQFGPMFSVVLQREVQGQVRHASAMEQSGFQSSLADLVRAYEPAIGIGSTIGSVVDGRRTPAEPIARMSNIPRTAEDLAEAFAAIKSGYEQLVTEAARKVGMDPVKFRGMIDAAGK